jgi:gliding motility-associated-like protein
MKKILHLIILLFFITNAFATHISGGEMSYVYLGPGSAPGTVKYQVNLTLYKQCDAGGSDLDPIISFSVFNTATGSLFQNINGILGEDTFRISKLASDPCIADAIERGVCFIIRKYSTIIDNLPVNSDGYTVAYQRCCRVPGMLNISSLDVGTTYFAKIPGNRFPGAETNTSPVFVTKDTVLICSGRPINFDFGATDFDNDSLVYSFYNAFTGGSTQNIVPNPTSPPPFTPVTYINGYNALTPLGNLVTINSETGLISGITPNLGAGANEIFALTVLVSEYRSGVKIGEHFKDLQIRVVDCNVPTALLNPKPVTCDGFSVSFSNDAPNNLNPTYYWQFDDPASGINDTSTSLTPSHTYTDTGVYMVKLVLNRGLTCGDSTTLAVKVYPGFFPGFETDAPFCAGVPVQFTDTTKTNYGVVDSWSWNFGDNTTLADTSHIKLPQYSFPAAGTYNVNFIVTNSKGCIKTINKSVVVNPSPVVSILNADTTYCALDSLQLTATGTGNFAWSPGTNIIGPTTATPQVFPLNPVKYFVTLTDVNGCKAKDSVMLSPLNDLTNTLAANPVTVCAEDTLTLTGTSNHSTDVSWQWSPPATLLTPQASTTKAVPLANTTYSLTTTWGKYCIATKTVTIPVKPLAIPNAGLDTSYCVGQNPVQLTASGGVTYTWSPAAGLSNATIANPTASPAATTQYVVSVGVTGCSRTKTDTILVTARQKPILQVTNDTLICDIDNLPLFANGTGSVIWTPNYMINSTGVANPIVSPDVPTKYRVRLTDAHGCFTDDSVFVDVKSVVAVDAGLDTAICKTEGFTLRTTGDALHYTWSPDLYLDDNTLKNPFANPPVTTLYTVTANIGQCQTQSSVEIKVAPYPEAFAGNNDTLCIGFNTQLHATGGSIYQWSPATYLNDAGIADPLVAAPQVTTQYIVTVSDTLGCTATRKDTVIVRVIPQLNVNAGPRDTTVVDGQSLALHATGALNYTWLPATWLSNNIIANPISLPQDSITYYLTGIDSHGCIGNDTIHIQFYTVQPDMYVPTAFTPNGDGNNDVARPILLGMQSLVYFKIFNRFGELVFKTSEMGKGWDGMYKGKRQDTSTFVWMAEGVTFKGQRKTAKGYVLLIR